MNPDQSFSKKNLKEINEIEPLNEQLNLDKESGFLLDSMDTTKENMVEITEEFVKEIIKKEQRRYCSAEAMRRAENIDRDFPPTTLEKMMNATVSQKQALESLVLDPRVIVADYLEENAGGYYRKQPFLVKRIHDFIEVTHKAKPQEFKNILVHEYNHYVTRASSNFSAAYMKYVRELLFSDGELNAMKNSPEYAWLAKEPFEGAGPLSKYLTSAPEINAYMNTNLRTDLVNNGILQDPYELITEGMLDAVATLKDTHMNSEKSPVYQHYLALIKDKKACLEWLNEYAV